MSFGRSEKCAFPRRLDGWPSPMFASYSLKTVPAWDQTSGHAIRDGRISAILRVAALVGVLFGAVACGPWAGMTWSADLSAADRGVMDSAY